MYKTRKGLFLTQEDLNRLEAEGYSELQIAREYKVSRMQLYKIRVKMGWPQVIRSDKGRERKTADEKRINRNAYMRQYYKAHNIQYKAIRIGKTILKEHRLAVETLLGVSLTPDKVVHHIDGNRLNNSPDNLQVFPSNAEHIRQHRQRKP
jgi:hypothetical protein